MSISLFMSMFFFHVHVHFTAYVHVYVHVIVLSISVSMSMSMSMSLLKPLFMSCICWCIFGFENCKDEKRLHGLCFIFSSIVAMICNILE